MKLLSVGIVFLVILFGIIVCYEEEKVDKEIGFLKKTKYAIKKYFAGASFLKTVVEILTIILGVTVAVWIGDIHEAVQQEEKTIELLEVSAEEIKESISVNTYLSDLCESDVFNLWLLKYNVLCNLGTLEKVLDNDDLIVTMSPRTYGVFCNYAKIARDSYETVREADENDEDIIKNVKALNKELTILINQIQIEIGYLNREYLLEDLEEKTKENLKSDGIALTPEEASAMMEEMRNAK